MIADYRKASSKLGQAWDYVPIEVLALAYRPLMARIEEKLGGRCEVNDIVSSDLTLWYLHRSSPRCEWRRQKLVL